MKTENILAMLLLFVLFMAPVTMAQTNDADDATLTEEELQEIRKEKKELIRTLENEVTDINEALASIDEKKNNPNADIDEATIQEYEQLEYNLIDYRELLKQKQEELQTASDDEWQKFVHDTRLWWAEVEKEFQETFDEVGETLAAN